MWPDSNDRIARQRTSKVANIGRAIAPLPRGRHGEIAEAPAQNGGYTYRPGCVAATARQAAMPARHEDDMAEPIEATVDAAQVERFSRLAGEGGEDQCQ